MREVGVDTFPLLIKTFLDRITEEQWKLLKSGSPNNATKILLAELLLEIIQAVTNTFLEALQNTYADISEEWVEDKLGDTLAQSFAEAPDIKD